MTEVTFGDAADHATVLYDRKTRVCIVVANAITHMTDAFAVVGTIKAEQVLVVAPLDAFEQFNRLKLVADLELYEYVK